MPIPFFLPVLGALGLGGAGLGAWAWWRSGRRPRRIADVIPLVPLDPDTEIQSWASRHGIDPDLVRAVIQVESAGASMVDGEPLVRVEVHLLEREAPDRRDELARHFRRRGSQPWLGHQVRWIEGGAWEDLHGRVGESLSSSQARERRALALARQLVGDEAALRSTSIGMGQLLGRHARTLGYASAAAMYRDAARGEGQQVRQMLEFVERDRGGAMVRALRARDLRGFSAIYNGSGQAERYAGLIQAAYDRLRSADA